MNEGNQHVNYDTRDDRKGVEHETKHEMYQKAESYNRGWWCTSRCWIGDGEIQGGVEWDCHPIMTAMLTFYGRQNMAPRRSTS